MGDGSAPISFELAVLFGRVILIRIAQGQAFSSVLLFAFARDLPCSASHVRKCNFAVLLV